MGPHGWVWFHDCDERQLACSLGQVHRWAVVPYIKCQQRGGRSPPLVDLRGGGILCLEMNVNLFCDCSQTCQTFLFCWLATSFACDKHTIKMVCCLLSFDLKRLVQVFLFVSL